MTTNTALMTNSSTLTPISSSSGGSVVSAASTTALLAHKNWKQKDLIAQFLSPDFDESKYLSTTLTIQSSSNTLDTLSALLNEISSEIHTMILTHHSSLLSINSHILLIEGEVQLVLRRINSLKAALTRIKQTLMQPYEKLSTAVQQLHTVQNTAEYIRQTIRVLNLCEKLKQYTTTTPSAATTPNSASNVIVPSSSTAPPPLRSLVKSATLFYEIHDILNSINLKGITSIDTQLPFLTSISDLLQNHGRKVLYESMRGDATAGGNSTQVNQVDLDYVIQMFYNIAPNLNVVNQLRSIQLKQQARGGRRTIKTDEGDSNDELELDGGTELIVVLDELVHTYLEQLRAGLRKIFDIAASQSQLIIDAKKKAAAGGSKKLATSTPATSTTSLRTLLWDRLESFTDLVFHLTIQIWILNKILTEKKDLVYNPTPGVTFQEIYALQREILKLKKKKEKSQNVKGNKQSKANSSPSTSPIATPQDDDEVSLLHTFWSGLCDLLREEFEAISTSTHNSNSASVAGGTSHNFLRTIFINEYPRFHNLFDKNIWERIDKYCANTVVASNTAMVNSGTGVTSVDQQPQLLTLTHRHILLTSFLPFFQFYLSRTLTILTEPLTLMFTSHESNSSIPTVPSRSDILTFLQVLTATMDSMSQVKDEEVQAHISKAINKSVNLFTQFVEKMVQTEGDRDLFSSTYLTQVSNIKSNLGLSHSHSNPSAANYNCSPVQRTNFDLFSILLQVEKELTDTELSRKYPQLRASNTTWAILTKSWQTIRKMMEEVLKVLLNTISKGLQSSLYGIVTEEEPAVVPADGSAALQAFKRRFLYCIHILFPMYQYQLNGGTGANLLSPIDVQSRQELWNERLLQPLNQDLIQSFIHLLSLQPLANSKDPSTLSEQMRSWVLNELTIFESLIHQLMKQPKKKSTGSRLTKLSPIDSGVSLEPAAPIDLLHGFKSMLFVKEMGEYTHLYTSKSVDSITLLHHLFTTASIQPHLASTNKSAPLTQSSPHRILQLRIDDYAKFIESHNLVEIYELFNKVYTTLESRIPHIPAGAAGRQFVQESYPKLAFALKILTKSAK